MTPPIITPAATPASPTLMPTSLPAACTGGSSPIQLPAIVASPAGGWSGVPPDRSMPAPLPSRMSLLEPAITLQAPEQNPSSWAAEDWSPITVPIEVSFENGSPEIGDPAAVAGDGSVSQHAEAVAEDPGRSRRR